MPTSFKNTLKSPLYKSYYVWTWLAVVFSVAVCSELGRLSYQQSKIMAEADWMLDNIRQARIDLSQGFLVVTLAGDTQAPFRAEEGVALINQAIVSLEQVKKLGIAGQPISLLDDRSWAGFEDRVQAFRSYLAAWREAKGEERNNLGVRMRIAFHDLEQYASRIDAASQTQLDVWNKQLNQTFEITIIVSTVLLCGVCVGVYLAGRNLRRAVRTMLRREEQLRVMGDNLPDGYIYRYLRTADGKPVFTYISAGVKRVHGVSAEDCLRDASCLLSLMDPAQVGEFTEAESQSARKLTEVAMDLRFKHPLGEKRVVHVRAKPVREEAGRIVWDGLVVDVTEGSRAEEEIRKKEAMLQEMGRIAKVGGWEFDVATGEGEWTEEVARIHDLDPMVKPNRGLGLSFYPGESRVRLEAALKEAVDHGTPYDLKLELVSARGTHKWVHVIGWPVKENGKVIRLRGSFQDISDLTRAEQALRQREHQLSLFVEHSPAAIAMLDKDLRYLAVSRRWLSGYNLQEVSVIGRSHYEIFPEIPERWMEIHRRCLAGAIERCDADAFPRADGSLDWVRWEVVPWRQDDGSVGGLIIFSEVITKQKESEEIIRRTQHNYEEIFNASHDAICVHDAATGRVLDVNEAMAQICGYASRQEFLAHDGFQSAMAGGPYDLEEARHRMRLAVEQGPQVFEWKGSRKNGEEFWVEVSLRSSQIDGQGRVLAVVRDISQRKAHELEIERLNRLYSTLSQVNQVIVRCQNREELFKEIARVMIEYGRLHAVWIGFKNDAGMLIKVCHRTNAAADLEQIMPEWENGCGVVAEMLRTSAPALCNDTLTDSRAACCRRLLPRLGIKSCAAFPLWFRGQVVGAFNICSAEANFFNTEETRLLDEIASDISFALNRLDEQEQRHQAEAALHESEGKYRGLIESSLDAILTVDPSTLKFTSGNLAALRMFGAQTVEEFMVHTPLSLSPEHQPGGRSSLEMGKEAVGTLMAQGSHFFEWRHRRISGEEFDASVSLRLIEWDNQPVIMSTIRDITAAKRVEAALRSSEEEFRVMFATASIGIAQADVQTGRYLRVNRRLCEITGYAEPELLQKHVSELTHPDDRVADWEFFQSVVRGELPEYHMEKRYVRKDGSIAWVNVNVTVIRDAAGKPLRTMATIENITERKNAEAERMLLTTAMEQAAESVVVTDVRGRILYVNPAFEKLTGFMRQEAIGQTPRILKSGRYGTDFYQTMWQTLTDGKVWQGRIINKKKDGGFFEEDATITPVRDSAGKVVNFVAVKRDITREVELESQIRQAQKMEGIGQLAGGVAHDFNNILAAIMLQAQLVEATANVSGKIVEDMHNIRQSCERGANLTRQLLLFSRKQVIQPRQLNLNEAITSITKMLQRIIGENVAIQLNLHARPLITHADPGMMDQVLLNLAVNGRDAMNASGQLTIGTSEITLDEESASHNPDASPGRYVCLSVSDTGTGIAPEVLPRIFEPFYTTKEQGKGTGLGLATVFGIIKQHKGWIEVETRLGQGTTFKIFLPASDIPIKSKSAESDTSSRLKGTETILLAEDDFIVRQTTRKFLEMHGYTVLEASNGVDALAMWKQHGPSVDLLLTDLLMPEGVNGRDLARQLRNERPGLKVIFFSGYSADLVGHGLELRVGENFLQKPFSPVSLLEILRRQLKS